MSLWPGRPVRIVGTGVANILGINCSEFLAWWLWRTIYLLKLPRFEKKVLVALDRTLAVLFSKDLVHFRTTRALSLSSGKDHVSESVWGRSSDERLVLTGLVRRYVACLTGHSS